MKRSLRWFVAVAAIGCSTLSMAQYPIMDQLAGRLVEKYQNSTCEQLRAQKALKHSESKRPMELRVLQMMRSDPQMRAAFIDKVAAPIANKMFECGMIP